MSKQELQEAVIQAAATVCYNAAYLPDGNAQVPTEMAETLGKALSDLADWEEREYKPYLKGQQTGLNPAQVALERINMSSVQLRMERLIDAADKIYLAFFDQVIIPGVQYLSLPAAQAREVRFLDKSAIDAFHQLWVNPTE